MSNIDCSACTDLREYAPNFVQNGVDATVCGSLMNNHGLNPSLTSLHSNCEDLHDVNDCLIGRMTDELEAYDVCDWKEFMQKHNSNLYELLKALICSDCGQWARIETLCALIMNSVAPNLGLYGVLPNSYGNNNPTHRGGQLEGGWVTERVPTSEEMHGADWRSSVVGIRFDKFIGTDCNGVLRTFMWYAPVFINHVLSPATPVGATLWSVDHDTAMSWGVPEAFWRAYSVSSWTWFAGFHVFTGSAYLPIAIMMRVNPETNRLELRYMGTLVGAALPANGIIETEATIERVLAI